MSDEFYYASEVGVKANEYNITSEKQVNPDEFNYLSFAEKKEKKSSMKQIRKMVYLIAACGSVITLGYAAGDSVLKEEVNPTVSIEEPLEKPVKKEEKEPEKIKKAYDDSFPKLHNLEKNSVVPVFGYAIDEEFLQVDVSGETYALWLGETRKGTVQTLPEREDIRYDEASNTLFLNNTKECSYINANLMGNSFTVNVTGECSVDKILIWGFYCGGSLRITGDGTLTVNESIKNDCGILLNAEDSETCLMIDKDITLKAYGSDCAIMVHNTTMKQAIYCLSTEDENVKRDILLIYDDGTYDYTLFDRSGEVLKEVSFGKH